MRRSLLVPSVLAPALVAQVALAQPAAAPAPPPPPATSPASPPAAPEPAEADKKDQARAHFEKAIALFEEEAWDAALVEFQRSRELYPTRAATKDAALCLRKLHRFDEALDMFEALVKEFPNLPPDDKTTAEREMRELAGLVGTIDLRGAEAGANVVIDGRARGAVPEPPIRVPAGTHFVRVTKEGFVPFETQAQVVGGQSSVVVVHMSALTQGGRLKVVEDSGKSVDVLVDGAVVGKTPWEGTLPVGEHVVLLRGEGNLGTQPAVAPVRLNQVTPITLVAEQLDATLRVEPVPAGASVAIDGVVVGRGLWEGKLRAGQHKVEVADEGFLPLSKQVALDHDKREVLSAQLERDPNSALWRAQNPPRFIFEVDGAGIFAPSLGGDLAAGCTGSCSKGLGTGFAVLGHGGYQLSSGLGFSLDGGYLVLSQKLGSRPAALQPVNLDANRGTEDDTIKMSGALFGASAQLHRGQKFPLTFRIGAGAYLANVKVDRSGTASTNQRPDPSSTTGAVFPAMPYDFSRSETLSAKYFYVAPEARFGVKLGERLEVGLGIEAMVLFAISQPKWADKVPIVPGASYHVGQLTFGNQSMTGGTIVLFTPNLGVRYEL